MRIHSQKIEDDFNLYFNDLQSVTQQSLRVNKENKEIFKIVYPLFVFIETLFFPSYFLDPTKQIELNQAIESGEKQTIIKARKALTRTKISKELREGLEKQYFTPYLNELYSDAFLLLNQYYFNNYQGCYVYLRRILEDLYKHIYYFDHKQEFYMVTSGRSEFDLGITPQFLKEYLKKTSYLSYLQNYSSTFEVQKETYEPKKQTIFDLNKELYSKTSTFVHPSSETSMSHFTSNSDLIYDVKKSKSVLTNSKQAINICVIFLISMHFQQFLQFNEFEKNLVLSQFKGQTKGNLRKVLGI